MNQFTKVNKEMEGTGLYTRAMAATEIGRSPRTLKQWHAKGLLVPTANVQVGPITMGLYTQFDIEEGLRLAQTIKPGRKSNDPSTQA